MERKYFGTDGVRGIVGIFPMTITFVLKFGNSLGRVLQSLDKKFDKKIIVLGQDTRISGDMLKSAFIAGITATGFSVVNLGVVPTPVIAFMVKKLNAVAGVMLTASHNPYWDNGIKLFSYDGYKISDCMENKLESFIQDNNFYYCSKKKFGVLYSQVNKIEIYLRYCFNIFLKKIVGFNKKVFVDCANGAQYNIVRELFYKLRIDFKEIASSPSGFNINNNCGSINLAILKNNVVKNNGALGISFDGDGDRLILIDELGQVVDGDDILAILAKDSFSSKKKFGIVGTIMTNLAIEKFFNFNSIPFIRAKVGDRYIMDTLINNNWYIGGESSGHIIDLRYNTTGDALITVLRIIEILTRQKKPLSKILNVVKMARVIVNIPLKRFVLFSDSVLLLKYVKIVRRILSDDGRIIFRLSGTEFILRIMIEGINIKMVRSFSSYIIRKIKYKCIFIV